MYILKNGKKYIKKNPMKVGGYISTIYTAQAEKFTFKQARDLLHSDNKSHYWIKEYKPYDAETGVEAKISTNYKGNGAIYIGENDIKFNENILDEIFKESKSLIGLIGWDKEQLEIYQNELNVALSKYDSAESDIAHALEEYKKEHNGKKPAAHKMSKLGYLLEDIRELRRKIKQGLVYLKIMIDAITYKYDIPKIRLELSRADNNKYKGRTEFYARALDILN